MLACRLTYMTRPARQRRCCRYFKRYAATYGFQGARTAVVLSGQVGGDWQSIAHTPSISIRVHPCFGSFMRSPVAHCREVRTRERPYCVRINERMPMSLGRPWTPDHAALCYAVSVQVPLLYWRRDVLASYGLTSAPATWDDLLAVATAINGTDLDGDGRGDPALCWYTQGCYDAGTVLSAILAPLTQQQVGDRVYAGKPCKASGSRWGPCAACTVQASRLCF